MGSRYCKECGHDLLQLGGRSLRQRAKKPTHAILVDAKAGVGSALAGDMREFGSAAGVAPVLPAGSGVARRNLLAELREARKSWMGCGGRRSSPSSEAFAAWRRPLRRLGAGRRDERVKVGARRQGCMPTTRHRSQGDPHAARG